MTTDTAEDNDDGGPTGGATPYADWMFDPDEIDAESAGFGYVDVPALLDSGAKSGAELESYYRDMFGDRLTVEDVEAMEYSFTVNQFVGLAGDVDGASLADGLGLSETEGYRDFTVYGDGRGYLLAESDEYVLAARGAYGIDSDTRTELELAVDTFLGDSDRYVESAAVYGELVSRVAGGTVAYGELPAPSVAQAAGESEFLETAVSQEIRNDSLVFTVVELYGGEADIDLAAVESKYAGWPSEDVTVRSSSQEGRLAVVELEGGLGDIQLEPI
ncbi:hypothetical protein [Haloarcula sediminis]|uniref:hypothetical protein n=1 Tax=Haloarcula sediminis TaxID=3111777 RepID=UPI002D7729BB|nr:hypothetical protein [Haloarcula sp. CK38]